MAQDENRRSRTATEIAVGTFATLGSLAIIVAALTIGAGFFIPLSIALLLFVLLTAIIQWIESRRFWGHHLPAWLSHVLGIGAVVLGLSVIVLILDRQAVQVAAAVPKYQERFASILERVVSVVGQNNAKLVEQQLNSLDFSSLAVNAVGQAGGFLGGLVLVLLYIAFMLAERGPMTRKLPLAIGDRAQHERILAVIQEVVVALQSYVGVKTLCSALNGILCFIVLRLIGLDFAETWALLAFALNFIPSIGAFIGVLLPAIVALVQFDAIGPFILVVVGCGIVQFSVGSILEPAIMGKSLNLSPFMVILSLTVWGTLWGVAGAFLSVPITVCLLIVCSHIPAIRPLAILLSGHGTLPKSDAPSAAAAQAEHRD